VINLAHIRKNYWNPADPSITFPRSRRVQARAAPNAPPVPSPANPPPAVPPAFAILLPVRAASLDDTKHSPKPALHCWECSSSLRSLGHGPSAHDARGLPSASHLARRPALTWLGGETSSVKDVVDTRADTNYVANVTEAQDTWDPWSTQDWGVSFVLLSLF